MPEISRFYGLIIKMYFSDHQPPNFHVLYNEYNAVFSFDSLEMNESDLPTRATNLIKEWGTIYKTELQKIWDTKEFTKLPGLK